MKFFIDTANIEEIKKANELGMVDGVTTNPSLVAKEGKEFKGLLQEICAMVDGPVSAEVVSIEAEGMIQERQVHHSSALLWGGWMTSARWVWTWLTRSSPYMTTTDLRRKSLWQA